MSLQARVSGGCPVARVVVAWLCIGGVESSLAQSPEVRNHPDIRLFQEATAQDGAVAGEALREIAAGWRDGYAGMVWDLARSVRPPGPKNFSFSGSSTSCSSRLARSLELIWLPGMTGSGLSPMIRIRITRFSRGHSMERSIYDSPSSSRQEWHH